ncbi:MAG TPA: peptidoglycan-binding protein [Caulobacteraceae bacterium]|nr:peptidoglycan-binding protein [Caulobacteraceae bacterium]
MNRRLVLMLTLAGAALPSAAAAEPVPSQLLGAAGDQAFLTWLDGFYRRQTAAGWTPVQLAAVLSGLAPDPRVLAHNAAQPEFALPVGAYVTRTVSPGTISLGRRKRDSVPELGSIHETYGVPADVLTAIWGMESGFGANQGDMDVVRCLATLAADDPPRTQWAETELVACLAIVKQGRAARGQLRGSWAGAMGQTQVLPSVFLTTAVSAHGGARPDIWNSSADALASAANLLAKSGWKRGETWGSEVTLRPGFDVGLSEGPKETAAWWAEKGAHKVGGSWSAADAASEAQLLLPAGAGGPAFLVLPNHFVIRTYNNSLAYALSVGLLADRVGGAGPLAAAWPHETPLSLEDRMAAQTALARLGYNVGPPDGLIGVGTRQALRAWQKDHHLPADGYLSPAVLAQLKASAKG